jgi:hypothetical protein
MHKLHMEVPHAVLHDIFSGKVGFPHFIAVVDLCSRVAVVFFELPGMSFQDGLPQHIVGLTRKFFIEC